MVICKGVLKVETNFFAYKLWSNLDTMRRCRANKAEAQTEPTTDLIQKTNIYTRSLDVTWWSEMRILDETDESAMSNI